MDAQAPAKLLVYGSLRQGFFNYEKALVGRICSRQTARVRGDLYHLSAKGYPALVHGDGWVIGELLTLDDFASTIVILDEIENYVPGRQNNEYERKLTQVENLDTGTVEQAYVYWYSDDFTANGAVPVPGGDWQVFMLNRR